MILNKKSPALAIEFDYQPLLDVGEGDPVILLHGLFGNLSNWSNVAEEFGKQYRVIIPRLPFYSTPISSERINDLALFVEQFINHHGFDTVTLMGNSLGGHVALLYTWREPSRVKKLVLAGSSGLFENSFSGTFPRIKDYEYIKEKVSSTFYKQEVVTKELVDEVYSTIQSKANTLSILGLARAAQRNNLADLLDQIDTPTLLVWGLQDTITPPEVALEFHAHLPHSQVIFLDHCGHVPMMEQPKLFNQYVREFLEH
jgi:pimeloyl-ACP methyl ester carboxylesterase